MHASLKELNVAFDAADLYKRAQALGRVVIARAYLAMKSEYQGEAAASRADASGLTGGLVAKGFLSISDWLARKYNEAGYTVRMVPPGSRQKDVDTALAVDGAQAIIEDRLDLAIIASGDADYVPIADLAHSMGKAVGIAAVDRSCSPALRARADLFLPIPAPSAIVTAANSGGR
jgi:uncharacterized LabA/DUF88 family protein